MGLFTKLNKDSKIFDIDTKDYKFIKPADLMKLMNETKQEKIKVLGLYMYDSKPYGKQTNVILENKMILNAPKTFNETAETILQDYDLIDSVKRGECNIKIGAYVSKRFNKECYKIVFVD